MNFGSGWLGSFGSREAFLMDSRGPLSAKPNASALAASPSFEAGVLEEHSRRIRVAGLGI